MVSLLEITSLVVMLRNVIRRYGDGGPTAVVGVRGNAYGIHHHHCHRPAAGGPLNGGGWLVTGDGSTGVGRGGVVDGTHHH